MIAVTTTVTIGETGTMLVDVSQATIPVAGATIVVHGIMQAMALGAGFGGLLFL